MKLALVNLIDEINLDKKLNKLFEFINHDDFMVVILFEADVLKSQNIQSLMRNNLQKCEMLDMRVIASNKSTVEQLAAIFTSVKANRLTFQAANSIKDLESILKLQIINKDCTFINI